MYVVKRSHHNPILVPDKDHYWEAYATFNMSVVKKGKTFFGVYRAMGAQDKLRTPDRVSIIGIGKGKDGRHFEDRVPFIEPEEEWEKFGCEDPRITYFEGKYYIFYTALSKFPFEASGIKCAVAVSKDLKNIDERHLITPFNAKAMALFPERVNGKITVMLTANTDAPPAKIGLAQVEKMEDLWDASFWQKWYEEIDQHVLDFKRQPADHIEVGAAPVKTKYGWLLVYSHIQNYFPTEPHLERIFGIEALLLDGHDPRVVIGRTKGPMLVPTEPYELVGHEPDIVFPSGALLEKETLLIYYGAADTTSCLARVNIDDLLGTIRQETSSRWHFERAPENPIIVPVAQNNWEAQAVFNPAALRIKNTTHILYRALSPDNTSTIGYAGTQDGVHINERHTEPVYVPREDFESKKISGGNSGCEDPRLTKIGSEIYMCYTAFDGIGPPRVAVSSISLNNFLAKKWVWKKPAIITPPGLDDKDTCIFPEKTSGKYFILHRVGDEICGDYLKSLNFETQAVKKCIRIIGPRTNSWDSWKVGISAPPLKTKHGWLLLYHGVSKNHHTYRVGAVLLSLKDPAIVIARSSDPIFEPEEKYEKEGVVSNVVFPCGMTEQNGKLYIYYGGADKVIGVATIQKNILLRALTRDLRSKK